MKKVWTLLVLGLAIRVILSFQFYSGDVNNHISWAKDILSNGSLGIYEREFYFRYGTLTPNYPPVMLFAFAFFYWLYEALSSTAIWLNNTISIFPSNVVYFFQGLTTIPAFLKIPAILADIGIAYYVYLFSKKLNAQEKWSLIAASFVLFNPAFFYNSALWGQVDSIPVFFVLASFYSLLYKKGVILSSVLFSLALLSKQTAIIFAPIFLLAIIRYFGLRQLHISIISILLTFFVAFLPFIGFTKVVSTLDIYNTQILTNSVSDYVTYHAFNFWTLFVGLEKVHDFNIFLFSFSYRLWGFALFGFFLLIVLIQALKKKGPDNVLLTAGIISFAAFLFLTRLHERHLEPALPFLLLVSILHKKLLPLFIFISLFHFVNLYHDWWAPRFDPFVAILSQIIVIKGLVVLLLISFMVFSGIVFLKKHSLQHSRRS